MVNKENGKRGADHWEFSPRFSSSASWPDSMEFYEKLSCRIR